MTTDHQKTSSICVLGGTGFIGRHLLNKLKRSDGVQIKVLTRYKKMKNTYPDHTQPVKGDVEIYDSLVQFLMPQAIVINLVYLNTASADDNIRAIDNLAKACIKVGVRRLIHCSTAVVAGSAKNDVITEKTPCLPANIYEKTKLKIENLLLEKLEGKCELVILRPTAVFGSGGKNLLKLANDLRYGNRIINYLKSCLFNYRKMNLVYIDNVVSSIAFLIDTDKKIDREIFIISDDEYSSNNYRDIEQYLMKSFGYKNYLLPRVPLPFFILIFLLKLAGKSNLNPTSVYDCQKLLSAGFKKPVLFEEGLVYFTDWYKIKFCGNQGSNN
jgi:nucleoside-diphosphate-sugar epimerase